MVENYLRCCNNIVIVISIIVMRPTSSSFLLYCVKDNKNNGKLEQTKQKQQIFFSFLDIEVAVDRPTYCQFFGSNHQSDFNFGT